MSNETTITPSSGNLFADLDLPHADEERAKVELAFEISQIIEERGLTQEEAAELIGVDQPKVSAVVRYRLDGFSMERLYRFLNALGRDIEIIVRPKPKSRKDATLSVTRKAGGSRVRSKAKA